MKSLKLILVSLLLPFPLWSQIKEAAEIDKIFSEWNKPDAPGCALGVIKDGKLIYSRGYGVANFEYNIPISDSSVFRIGSTSKQFTAACIILLAQQGKLDLDNTLDKYYPDFPDYAKKITIRHLLHHTSGIRDYLMVSLLKGIRDDDYYTDKELMSWMINQSDLNFEPGEEHLYSNTGYWLLGQIVNKAAGMSMAEYAKKEIFQPLGMTNTHFHDDHTLIVKNRAIGYTPGDNDDYKIYTTTLDIIGDGGIFTTVRDIKKWDDAFYNSKVLNKEFWEMMTQGGKLNNGDTIDYACGLLVTEYKGLKEIRHGGAFVGYRAEIVRFPEQHLSVVVLANREDADPTRKAHKVVDVLLKDKLKVDKKTTDTEESEPIVEENTTIYDLSQLVGNYEIQPGLQMNMSIKEDSLHVLQQWNGSEYNIARTVGNTYQIPGVSTLSFTFSDLQEDLTQSLKIIQNGEATVCKRKNEIDKTLIKTADYIGDYYSKELDVIYHVTAKGEGLLVSIKDNEPMELELYDKDQYTSMFGLFRFQRIGEKLTGFQLDAGRVKNLKFAKQ